MTGTLYIVSTPIGNPEDISRRALRVLSEANVIICEEMRVGQALLRWYQIDKPLIELNEHTDDENINGLVDRLSRGENLALVSDHGTPLLTDPGEALVQGAIRAGVTVTPIPGASSFLAALVVSGLSMSRFRFVGLLPAKKEERKTELDFLRRSRETLVILDAPYRLRPLLADLCSELGGHRQAAVACNLTTEEEKVERGSLQELSEHFEKQKFKGEFVVVVEGNMEPAGRLSPSRHASK